MGDKLDLKEFNPYRHTREELIDIVKSCEKALMNWPGQSERQDLPTLPPVVDGRCRGDQIIGFTEDDQPIYEAVPVTTLGPVYFKGLP